MLSRSMRVASLSRAVTAMTGLDELGRLAAGGRAEVEDHAGPRQVQKSRGNGSCGVLHPEAALGIAGELLDRFVAFDDADGVADDWRLHRAR